MTQYKEGESLSRMEIVFGFKCKTSHFLVSVKQNNENKKSSLMVL